MVWRDCDHDSTGGSIGATCTLGTLGGEGFIGAVLVIDTSKGLGCDGAGPRLEGTDGCGDGGVDARVAGERAAVGVSACGTGLCFGFCIEVLEAFEAEVVLAWCLYVGGVIR